MVRKYDPSLVMYLPFFEGEGDIAHDVTGNGNNGVIYGAEWVDTGDPKLGYGLSFDGVDDYVEVADSASLDITDAITIMVWVKANTLVPDYQVVVRKGSPDKYAIYLTSDGEIYWYSEGLTPHGFTSVGANIQPQQWYHITVTYDGDNNEVTFYRNGKMVGSPFSVSGSGLGIDNNPLRIGRYTGTYPFSGIIASVRIYNRALSESEIKRLYHLGYIRYVSVPSIVHSLNLKGWE